MLAPPLKAQSLTGVHIAIAPNNEQPQAIDGPLAESSQAVVTVAAVVQIVEPVHDLTEAMSKA
jgi:hypothetical protein